MGVTVTLVFSDEAHREAWLENMEIVPDIKLPPKDTDGKYPLPADRADQRKRAKRIDYEHRRSSQNLMYIVGMLGGSNPKYVP